MIDERCVGCRHVIEGNPYRDFLSCEIYPFPMAKWRLCACPMATHFKREAVAQGKVRVGQQKQKKG